MYSIHLVSVVFFSSGIRVLTKWAHVMLIWPKRDLTTRKKGDCHSGHVDDFEVNPKIFHMSSTHQNVFVGDFLGVFRSLFTREAPFYSPL